MSQPSPSAPVPPPPAPHFGVPKTKRDILLGLAAFAGIIALSFVQLRFLGADSVAFLILFNVNFVVLLVVLAVVLRNAVKLLMERRKGVLGSRVRARLTLAFIALSLVPTLLLGIIAANFIRISFDYWFTTQVGGSLENAMELGTAYYGSVDTKLRDACEGLALAIGEDDALSGKVNLDNYIARQRRIRDLAFAAILTDNLAERAAAGTQEAMAIWDEIKDRFDPATLYQSPYWSMPWAGQSADLLFAVVPLPGGVKGYVAAARSLDHGVLLRLARIKSGIEEYAAMKTLSDPVLYMLYGLLGVISLSIILGASWFGFRVAKDLTDPVMSLIDGTRRIAQGDFSVRLAPPPKRPGDGHSGDELGYLVNSFNTMAEDLEKSRAGLTEANLDLEAKNLALAERGRYIEAVLNNITAAVISLDAKGVISTVNRAAEALFGLHGPEVMGLTPDEAAKASASDIAREVLTDLATRLDKAGRGFLEAGQGERRLKLARGIVIPESLGEPGEAAVVAVYEDVTELERTQRAEAWREVARRIAHEIKNPLTPIKLSAQRLKRKFADRVSDPSFAECTDLIVAQTDHLRGMVSEFSAYAKLPEISLSRGDLGAVAADAVALYRLSHGRIAWEFAAEANLPEARIDPAAMGQVAVNLLANAAEALEETASPRVSVCVSHETAIGQIRLEVTDNGPGLAAADVSRLFEPYFSRKKGGTGLGLTIVKAIVTDHGGTVRARPADQGGAVFTVEIPVA